MKKFFKLIFLVLFIAFFTTTYAQKKQKEIMIKIETSMGDIKIKLYNETPVHRDNFIKLVNDSFYNDILFHRVIKDFMIQAGDPESKNAEKGKQLGSGGPGYQLPAEILPQFFHKKGALSAARIGDQQNPQRRSSGSQFYIVQGKKYTDQELNMFEKRMYTKFSDNQRKTYTTIGGTPFLDAQYTVFGEVVEGIEIVDKIAAVKCVAQDRPEKDIKIIKMSIVKK